jgi:hypothetical protein
MAWGRALMQGWVGMSSARCHDDAHVSLPSVCPGGDLVTLPARIGWVDDVANSWGGCGPWC